MIGISANTIPPAGRPFQLRPKYLLFGLVGLMVLTVLYRDRVLMNSQAPLWDHYRYFKWWLLPHGIAGALALLLGPLQFSQRLRKRFLPRHRIAGRVYVGAVAVAAPLGIWIEYIKYAHAIAPLRLFVASSGFGALFALTTALGFFAAKRRDIQTHRRWMTRSYAVALVFLETRCIDKIPWLSKLWDWPSTILETYHISDLWLVIALSLLCAELLLRVEKFHNTSALARKSAVSAAAT